MSTDLRQAQEILCRRLHRGEGLRPHLPGPKPRAIRAAAPPPPPGQSKTRPPRSSIPAPAKLPPPNPSRRRRYAKGPDRDPLHIATAHHHWPAFTPPHWPAFTPPHWPGNRPPLTTERGGVKLEYCIVWSFWGWPGMFAVEVYAAVRRFVFIDGNSRREAA